MSQQKNAVGDILDHLRELAGGNDRVTVEEVIEAIGYRGYGPFLLLPALLELSPLGAVPLVPTLLASIVFLFAIQIAVGRKQLWLPDRVEQIEVSAERLGKAADTLDGLGQWMDRWFHERLRPLTRPGAMRAGAICVLVLCLTVPPLELVPLATTAPMAAIAVFGLAMTVRDGVLMLAGFTLAGLAFVAGYALGT